MKLPLEVGSGILGVRYVVTHFQLIRSCTPTCVDTVKANSSNPVRSKRSAQQNLLPQELPQSKHARQVLFVYRTRASIVIATLVIQSPSLPRGIQIYNVPSTKSSLVTCSRHIRLSPPYITSSVLATSRTNPPRPSTDPAHTTAADP